MSALVNTHLHETATLALVICILAAITLGFLYVLMRGAHNTRPEGRHRDELTPEAKERIKARVMQHILDQDGEPR